tara:strand:- start:19309 stop:20508 length:1200 start_codon:yes stop_codon:yes gene_type:complete
MEEQIRAKRELGDGRWDKILKRKMTELSVSDDYNVAKHEWTATGNVWWSGMGGEERPHWAREHPDQCLCTHRIIYHFEILNTENQIRECVGSDHINTYLIIRAIADEMKLSKDDITEDMIQEWIDVRVESMKKTAWWASNGNSFTEMFNLVKEYDLRINVRSTGKKIYDTKYARQMEVTKIRKVGKGTFGSPSYKMASIVWRWNHPDNPRNQQGKKGYPNEKLMNDLTLFFAMVELHKETISKEDEKLAERLAQVDAMRKEQADIAMKAAEDGAKRLEQHDAKLAVVRSVREAEKQATFEEKCAYFDLPNFSVDDGDNDWERRFIGSVRSWIVTGKEPTEKQVATLRKILNKTVKDAEPATTAQCNYLRNLGFDGDFATLNKRTASQEIDKILKERNER